MGNKGAFLFAGECLSKDDYLQNSTKTHFAIMQPDGNFVVYKGSSPPGATEQAVWHTATYLMGESVLVMTYNGVLQVRPGKLPAAMSAPPGWQSNTAGNFPAGVRCGVWLRNDGTLVIFYASPRCPYVLFPIARHGQTALFVAESTPFVPIEIDKPAQFWTEVMGHASLGFPPKNAPPTTPGTHYGPGENFLMLGGAKELGLHDASFTVECWINITEFPVGLDMPILAAYPAEGGYLHLVVRNKRLYMGFFANDNRGKTELQTNRFYHVVFRYDRAKRTQTIFLDGKQDQDLEQPWTEANHSPLMDDVRNVVVGRYQTHQFHGRISDLRVWNHARTQEQILLHRHQQLTGAEEGLTAYWPHGAPERPAMAFDGLTAAVALPALRVDLTFGLTLEAWVKVDDLTSGSCLVELGQIDTNKVQTECLSLGRVGTSGDLCLKYQRAGKTWQILASAVIPARAYVHIAGFIGSDGQLGLYVNGVLVATKANDQQNEVPFPTNGVEWNTCYLGKSASASLPKLMEGQLAEVRLWSSVRTAEQINGAMHRELRGDEDQLCGYWKLDARSYPGVFDETQYARHGSLLGFPIPAPFPVPVGAPVTTQAAVRFVGGDSQIDCGLASRDFTGGLTAEAWVYPEGTDGLSGFLAIGDKSQGDYIFFLRGPAGQKNFGLVCGRSGIELSIWSPAGLLRTGVWQHVAATVDKDGLARLYLNGELVSVQMLEAFQENRTPRAFRLGRAVGSLQGVLARVRLWQRCRSAAEIRAAMIVPPNAEPALVQSWNLDDGGNIVRDIVAGAEGSLRFGAVSVPSYLPLESLLPVPAPSCVTHQGKPILFRQDRGTLVYSVRQSGFEDTALSRESGELGVGWEPWQPVDFPAQQEDPSVIAQEQQQFSYLDSTGTTRMVMRSVYRSANDAAAEPIRAVSTGDALYVFRQSKRHTLLCDRFILDGLNNKLLPKIEVRYRRSGQRYVPSQPAGGSSSAITDSPDWKNESGAPFIEPTTELAVISPIRDGLFSVVSTPTDEPEVLRWHVFAWDEVQRKLCIHTLRTNAEGRFDFRDGRSYLDQSPFCGVTCTEIELTDVALVSGLAAVRYDIQREQVDREGQIQLMRDSMRVMLVLASTTGSVALSFAVAKDGTLSRISDTGAPTPLCSTAEEIQLPLSTLDKVETLLPQTNLASNINSVRRDDAGNTVLGLSDGSALKAGESIVVTAPDFSGTYATTVVNGTDSFEIVPPSFGADPTNARVGTWRKYIDPEAALTFDGQVQKFELTPAGSLRVTAPGHGLKAGDRVRILGLRSAAGTFAVQPLGNTEFLIQQRFPRIEAKGIVRIIAERLRGICLGSGDSITMSSLPRVNASYTIEVWFDISSMPSSGQQISLVDLSEGPDKPKAVSVYFDGSVLTFVHGATKVTSTNLTLNVGWHHVAAICDAGTLALLLDGARIATGSAAGASSLLLPNATMGARTGTGNSNASLQLAELRLWQDARTEVQIQVGLGNPVSGTEMGLVGYWPLGSIAEGGVRQVYDLTPNARHGTVLGRAFVVEKKLAVDDKAVYRNEDLLDVRAGGQYQESFEFKALEGTAPTKITFTYWYKSSRSASTADNQVSCEAVIRAVAGAATGWFEASCHFNVPVGRNLMRTFEIRGLQGGSGQIAIRRHRLRFFPAPISRQVFSAPARAVGGSALAMASVAQDLKLAEQSELEVAALEGQLKLANDRIALLSDSTKYNEAKAVLASAQKDYDLAAAAYIKMKVETPFKFWCTIVNVKSGKALDDSSTTGKDGAEVYQYTLHTGMNQQWAPGKVNELVDGWSCYLQVRSCENIITDFGTPLPTGTLTHVSDGEPLRVRNNLGGAEGRVLWFTLRRQIDGSYEIWDDEKQHMACVYGAGDNDKEKVIMASGWGGSHQRWNFKIVADSHHTQEARNTMDTRQRKLTDAKQSVKVFEDAQGDLQGTLKSLNELRDRIKSRLERAQMMLTMVRTRLMKVLGDNVDRLQMSQFASDTRKLTTQAIALPLPIQRAHIDLMESASGNLLLSFIDARGCLGQATFDPVAGGNSTTFECWTLDAVRRHFTLRENGHKLQLARVIAAKPEMTLGAWVFFPLPQKSANDWSLLPDAVLDCADNGESMIAFKGGVLGSYLVDNAGGRFYASGCRTSNIRAGWHYVSSVKRRKQTCVTTDFYIDGVFVGNLHNQAIVEQQQRIDSASSELKSIEQAKLAQVQNLNLCTQQPIAYIGNSSSGGMQIGSLCEVRIWGLALSPSELAMDAVLSLSGAEPGLLGYFPLSEGKGEGRDATGSSNFAKPTYDAGWTIGGVPLGRIGRHGGEMVALGEFSTVAKDPHGDGQIALMRRYLACSGRGWFHLLSDLRMDGLDMQWIGTDQFAPTLLGYIEGAPPVPSENLTIDANYNGASFVELNVLDVRNMSFRQQRDFKKSFVGELFVGVDFETDIKFALFATLKYKNRVGLLLEGGFGKGTSQVTSTSASVTSQQSDRLELRGNQETVIKFPHLGKRFIPKNVGYAFVISGTADVYALRLRKSRRMVAYQVVPNKDIPPDVNTISFLINPTYIMNGSLDGMTGSLPTSSRFFADVPKMRAQHGATYPASYMRINDAVKLKAEIEKQDQARQAYFENFQLDTDAFRPDAQDPGGSAATTTSSDGSSSKSDEETKARVAKIQKTFESPDKVLEAASGLATWQKQMEELRNAAGKRNIVNTYVWDADGGMHVEAQQFASTIEHSLGRSFDGYFRVGEEWKIGALHFAWEGKARGSFNYTTVMTKTQSNQRSFSLNVNVAKVEGRGVTDFADKPIQAGEKVGRYRFMSFFLEGAVSHFNDFFEYVVDPEWLAGNSESARALRQVNRSNPNKTWRVLHRVTYVERPALAGFGRDHRPLGT